MTLKDQLLHEALRQFSTRGYNATSTSSIIAAVGTSKGGLYNHFKSKEQLFLQALDLARQIWRERNLQGLDQLARPIDQLIKLLENYRDHYLTDADNLPGGCIFVNLAVEVSDEHPLLGEQIGDGFTRLKAMIERLLVAEQQRGTLAEGCDPEQAAELLFAGILGASVVFSATKSTAALHRTIDALRSYLSRLKR